MTMDLNDKVILVTGGTGSFGRKFTETVLGRFQPKKLIIFSRDELKQSEMHREFPEKNVRYFIGDVRDLDRLRRAMRGVDIVVHAAALKQVPACEYNPFEAVKTNVIGGANVIDGGHRRRREEGARDQHRQGRQPGQPVRRDEAVRGEAVRAGQLVRGRGRHALQLRPLRQRRRQPRQRDSAVRGTAADRRRSP